jgi:hypothetical protein
MPDFNRIFAESGLKSTIGDTEYDGGWDHIVGSNPPSFKDFNSIMNEQDSKLTDLAKSSVDFFTDSGVADAYVLSGSFGMVSPDAYVDGMLVRFIAGNTNTGASTVNVSGIGVKNIKLSNGTDPKAGDIDGRLELVYDLANDWFELKREKAIGVNQTWQDLTASRAAGVTYTNSTGAPIYIYVSAQNSSTGGSGVLISINGTVYVRNYTNAIPTNTIGAGAIIPPGSTYSVQTWATSAINYFTELR